MTLKELRAKLDLLSPVKTQFVANVVDSLSNPPRANIRVEGTWLTSSPDWIEYFGLALSVHHGATTEPLGLKSFETVFRNACAYMGWKLDPSGSSTQRFVDLIVQAGGDGKRRISLKSTAARNISETTVHISKLTEAAWIQDLRTPKDRRKGNAGAFPALPASRYLNCYVAGIPRFCGNSETLSTCRNSGEFIRLDSTGIVAGV